MLSQESRSMLDDLREGDSYIEISYWHAGKRRIAWGVYEGLIRYNDGRWAIELRPGDGWSRQYPVKKISSIRRIN